MRRLGSGGAAPGSERAHSRTWVLPSPLPKTHARPHSSAVAGGVMRQALIPRGGPRLKQTVGWQRRGPAWTARRCELCFREKKDTSCGWCEAVFCIHVCVCVSLCVLHAVGLFVGVLPSNTHGVPWRVRACLRACDQGSHGLYVGVKGFWVQEACGHAEIDVLSTGATRRCSEPGCSSAGTAGTAADAPAGEPRATVRLAGSAPGSGFVMKLRLDHLSVKGSKLPANVKVGGARDVDSSATCDV